MQPQRKSLPRWRDRRTSCDTWKPACTQVGSAATSEISQSTGFAIAVAVRNFRFCKGFLRVNVGPMSAARSSNSSNRRRCRGKCRHETPAHSSTFAILWPLTHLNRFSDQLLRAGEISLSPTVAFRTCARHFAALHREAQRGSDVRWFKMTQKRSRRVRHDFAAEQRRGLQFLSVSVRENSLCSTALFGIIKPPAGTCRGTSQIGSLSIMSHT